MSDPLTRLLERTERALERLGVKRFEIYVEEAFAVEAEVMDGELSALERSEERSVAVRVLDGGLGFAAATEPDDEGLALVVEAARDQARRARPAAIGDFAGPSESGPPAGPWFEDPRATGEVRREVLDLAFRLEALALAADPAVARVRPASVGEARGRARLRTSAGLDIEERYARAHAYVGVVAESEEDTRMGHGSASAPAVELLDVGGAAAKAARAAAGLLGATSVRTGRLPVILSPQAASELVTLILGALAADRVERGASFLAGRLGQSAFAPALTLVEVPHDPALDGAAYYDGEGLLTRRQPLVEAGVVRTFLYDREAAARAGAPPSGSAVRGGRQRPHPATHSVAMAPGKADLEALLRAAEGGLYLEELSGAHTMNEVTGELSLGATGWRVGGGALGAPFEAATIAGTILGLLGGSVLAGRETEDLGDLRIPALLLEEVQVASAD